jgi:hypothetical protein
MVPRVEDLVAHNNARFLRQTGNLRMYLGDAATVVAEIGGALRQLCLLGFMSDGSIFVYWAYLPIESGVLDEVTFPPGRLSGSVKIKLSERRYFASQKVKYSHHASGEAHFNLSGREPVRVRRPAFPLTGPIGRVFELNVHFPLAFKPLESLKAGRVYLPFRIPAEEVPALRIRGEWRRKRDIQAHIVGDGSSGPMARYQRLSSGEQGRMFFFGPSLSCPLREHVLCVIGEVVPLPKGVTEPGVIFMGGYEPHEVMAGDDPDEPRIRGALVAIYPFRERDSGTAWIRRLLRGRRHRPIAEWLGDALRRTWRRVRGWLTNGHKLRRGRRTERAARWNGGAVHALG